MKERGGCVMSYLGPGDSDGACLVEEGCVPHLQHSGPILPHLNAPHRIQVSSSMAGPPCPTENTHFKVVFHTSSRRTEGDGGEIRVFTRISMPPGSLGS